MDDLSRERLLSLDGRDVEWRMALAHLAHELYGALIAARTAHQEALYHRLFNPRPGDYVYETSSLWRKDIDGYRGVGFVQRVVTEPIPDWPADDSPNPGDTYWYIQYGPAEDDVCRWENCVFRTIPVGRWVEFRRSIDEHAHALVRARG